MKEIPLHLRRRLAQSGQPKMVFGKHARQRKRRARSRFEPEEFLMSGYKPPTQGQPVRVHANEDALAAVLDNGQLWGTGRGVPLGYDLESPNRYGYDGEDIYPWIYLGISNVKDFKMTATASGIALRNDGTVWVTGRNQSAWGNSLGLGSTPPTGGVSGSTYDTEIQDYRWIQIPGLTNVVQIDASVFGCVALKSDGTLWGWGAHFGFNNAMNGPGYDVPTHIRDLTDVKQVSLGFYHMGVIKNDDSLWVWGNNSDGCVSNGSAFDDQLTPQQVATGVKEVSCGHYSTMCVKHNGELWGCGRSASVGVPDDPTPYDVTILTRVTTPDVTWESVSCGAWYALASDSSNFVYSTGWNDMGVLGRTPPEAGYDAGYDDTFGKVVTGMDVPLLSSGIFATDIYRAILFDTTCHLWAWGENFGELGLADDWGEFRVEPLMPIIKREPADAGPAPDEENFEHLYYLNPCPIKHPNRGDNSEADGANSGGDNGDWDGDPDNVPLHPEEYDNPPTPPPGPPDGSDPNYPEPFTPDPGNFLPDGNPPFDPFNPDTWPDDWPGDFDPENPDTWPDDFDVENPNTWPDDFAPDNPDFYGPSDPNFNNPDFSNPFDPDFAPTDPIFDPLDPTYPNIEGAFPTGPNQFPMGDFSMPMPDDIKSPDFPGIMPDYLPGADIAPYFPDPFPSDFEYPEMPCFGCGEIGEIILPEFPIDPCFELPAMEGYDPCGGSSGGGGGGSGGGGGGYDGGGWGGGTGGGGGDWGGGGDIGVPGDGGGVIPDPWPDGTDIDVVVDPPYSTDDTFAEKKCYTDHSARAALEELTARVGVDPANVTYEDDRDRNFTKCFEAGTRVWDAIWWLADYLGYVVFDPGDYNVEIVPPEPLDIFWVHNEYIDLIEFTRNYDAMEVYYGVEVYRPESIRGGVVAIPSFTHLELVNTIFSVDPTNILRIQALPEWTDQQCIDHAKQQASMMRTGLSVTVATPLNMRARFRHQIIVAKPSKNFYMRFMIMKTVHSLSSNGNLSIHECVYKGTVDGAVAHQMGLANSESGYADYFLGRASAVSPPTISAMGIGGV